jgi:riboflavin synthase
MFSGIVEEVGTVRSLRRRGASAGLAVAAERVLTGTKVGDSLAVNGACLTVTMLDAGSFTVGLSPETLRRTNLGDLRPGSPINLERALTVGDRLGGHFVQGHVDGVGRMTALLPQGDARLAQFQAPSAVMRYVVLKGFIAVDGVSLTVAERDDDSFTVSLVPHTLANTILGRYQVGDRVNLEADIIGKYVERFLMDREKGSTGLSLEFLARHGFGPE